jgi:cell division septation protein DedD
VASLLQMRGSGTAPVRVQYLGPAPLGGDDRYERQVLARQPWAGPRVAFASSPAKAIRHARQPVQDQRYGGRYLRAAADPETATGTRPDGFDSRMSAEPPIRRDIEARTASVEAPRRRAPDRGGDRAPDRTAAARPAAFQPDRADPTRTASLYAPDFASSDASQPQRIRGVFVEAGLFRQRETAERLAKILSDLAPVSLRMETVGGTNVHRLRVGPFAGNSAAQTALDQMRAAGLTGAYLQPAPGG